MKNSLRQNSKVAAYGKSALITRVAFKSKHPFFCLEMFPSHLSSGRGLPIPTKFVRDYMKWSKQEMMLQVADASWPVTFSVSPGGRCRAWSGWDAFAKENALTSGDICVFERISDMLMKVSISRRCLDMRPPEVEYGSG